MSAEFRIFRGAARVETLPPDDRGLAYGDALFETMRAHEGDVPWWGRHWSRLQASALRLRMPLPDETQVHDEARKLLTNRSGVLKLQVTRGSGGRGYALPASAEPTWLLSLHPLPASVTALDVMWCETRLARQPLLAGMKHGNRLEQVMARAEVQEAGADEGLVRDIANRVTSGTASNLFILRDDAWLTPELDHAGVAGVCRAWVMEQMQVTVCKIRHDEVMAADAALLCNAVRGILPVRRLETRVFPPHAGIVALQAALAAAHPGFAHAMEAQ